MFYSGDLQSGISKAVQDAKLVACFVTDNLEESQLWEHEFLAQASLKLALEEQSILLRIQAGSQEATYLAAIFPLPKNPTLVLIKNGELKEYIAAGVAKEEFTRRLGKALGLHAEEPSPPTSSTQTEPQAPPTASSSRPQPSVQSENAAAAVESPVPARAVQDLFAERSARLAEQKKEHDAKEKAKKAAEAKARREALDEASKTGSAAAANMKYALMQKKRQQEARDERARILKRVEDDRAEIRDREARRKQEANSKASTPIPHALSEIPSSSSGSLECALQVRLFDGSTIRSRFPSQGSLRKDVRPWVDEKQVGDVPYTFKLVLSPYPNKNIEISDEENTLQELGLAPSATLLIIPVSSYTSAYDGNAGYVSRAYGLVSSGVGMVTGMLGSFLGGGAAPQPAREPEGNTQSAPPATSINVRTLRDQDRPNDQQFYNGNALNFEPRADDERRDDE